MFGLLFSFAACCSSRFNCGNVVNADWFYVAENDTIFFDFGNEEFKVDTLDFVEGMAYYHRSQSDSSYFRINSNSPWARFDYFSTDSIYKTLSSVESDGILDKRGIIISKGLYWRSLKFLDFEVVYDNCPLDKLEEYDKVLDSVCEQYKCSL